MHTFDPRDIPELRADLAAWFQQPDIFGGAEILTGEYRARRGVFETQAKRYGVGPDPATSAGHMLADRYAVGTQAASLYHVTEKMTGKVLKAAETLPDFLLRPSHLPSPNGFLLWGHPISQISALVDSFPESANPLYKHDIIAVSWFTIGGLVHVIWWSDKTSWLRANRAGAKLLDPSVRVDYDLLTRHTPDLLFNGFPPLVMGCNVGALPLDTGPDWVRSSRLALRTLLSTWLMMNQPTVVESRVDAPRSAVKRIRRIDPNLLTRVRCMALRTAVPRPRDEAVVPGASGRHLSVRFPRKEHWRHYKHERFSEEVRSQPWWIDEVWAGPEGAPVLRGEKVYDLRR